MSVGMFTDEESSNKIKLSQLVHLTGCIWVPHTYAYAHTHAYMYKHDNFMQMAAPRNGFLQGIPIMTSLLMHVWGTPHTLRQVHTTKEGLLKSVKFNKT